MYLLDLGLTRHHLDASGLDHDAAYAAWVTREVQAALDDPSPSFTHEEVVAEWKLERAALLRVPQSNAFHDRPAAA